MYSPVPNREPYLGGAEREGGSTNIEYVDDSNDDSANSDDSEEVESPPHSERRSKKSQDPVGGHGKAVATSVRTSKRTWTSTPDPTKKTTKQAKTVPPKPRKVLPRIKVTVPIAST